VIGGSPLTVTDSEGRRLTLRHLNALDKLRLFKAAGPELAQNAPWLGMALLASSVSAIDDIPVPAPVSEQQIESLIGRLGDTGLAAVSDALEPMSGPEFSAAVTTAGNSCGIPN
jgi:hypothetical protein